MSLLVFSCFISIDMHIEGASDHIRDVFPGGLSVFSTVDPHPQAAIRALCGQCTQRF